MSYEVLARKWRPKQFAEVVGQDHVTHTLENAIKTGRVAHAYLFVGPRGTGKTSIARIFAKALNCAKGITTTPCDACPSCLEIASGANLDVQEIDGASNRGLADVQALRDNVKYAASGRHRIFIIDEVHMLTVEAFNALLKTLEEPPPHVKFLFATTEPHKIPLTIVSRCQRFDLRRIPVKLLSERLAAIAKDEKITADENVLLALARAAEGSLRDAESGLDQLVSFKGNVIEESDVLSVFGLVSRQAMDDLALAVLKGDVAAVVRRVEEIDNQGKDMQRLLVEMLEHFLRLLVFAQSGPEAAASDLPSSVVETLRAQAPIANADRLVRIVEILIETMDRLRYSLSRKTLMEAALIKCSRASAMVSLDSILAQVKALKAGLASAAGPAAKDFENAGQQPPRSEAATAGSAPAPALAARSPDEELALLKKKWQAILDHMGRVAVLAKNALLDAQPISVSGDCVAIGFDKEFPDRVQQIKIARNQSALQNELGRTLGRPVSIRCELVDFRAGPNSAVAQEQAPAPSGGSAAGSSGAGRGSPGSIRKWMGNETVIRALDMFNGSISDVKE